MIQCHGWSLSITMRGTFTLLFAGLNRRFRCDPVVFHNFYLTVVPAGTSSLKKGMIGLLFKSAAKSIP